MVAVLVFTGTDFEGMKETDASEAVLAIVRRMPGIIGMRQGRDHGPSFLGRDFRKVGISDRCLLVNLNQFSSPTIAVAESWREMLFNLHFSGLAGRPDMLYMVLR